VGNPAAGGGRWVEVAPERFAAWAGNFGRRHGQLAAAASPAVLTLTAADGSVAGCHVPFPPMRSLAPGSRPAAPPGEAPGLGEAPSLAEPADVTGALIAAVAAQRAMARANRAFMQRAARFLAGEAGIRQFIDIGTGIPSAGNVHEVAGQAAPGARVVYVDNDPIVHVHANALLTGSGTTSIVLADLRDPGAILAHPKLRDLIDFTHPVALLLVAIVHFITGEEDPAGIVAALLEHLVVGRSEQYPVMDQWGTLGQRRLDRRTRTGVSGRLACVLPLLP